MIQNTQRALLFLILGSAFLVMGVGLLGQNAYGVEIVTNSIFNAEFETGQRFSLVEDFVLIGEELGKPCDVAVSSIGQVSILDKGFCQVHVYDELLNYQYSFGNEGEGPGSFRYPTAICYGEGGEIFVADRSRIQKFDASGDYLDGVQHEVVGGFPQGLKLGEGGRLFLLCYDVYDRQVIHIFDSSLTKLKSFADSYGVSISKDLDVREERYYSGGAIDVKPCGDVLFTQKAPYKISVFNSTGEELLRILDDGFVGVPKMLRHDNVRTFPNVTKSVSVLALPGDLFLNSVQIVLKNGSQGATRLDMFDASGSLVSCQSYDGLSLLCATDSKGRLYGIRLVDEPQIVRYVLTLPGNNGG